MIAILSPAKTINMESKINTKLNTKPIFLEEACELMNQLQQITPPEMTGSMKISEELAEMNFKRHIRWQRKHTCENSRNAILAFSGAVYQGLKAEKFTDGQLKFAQEHLIMLSGLYGILRPLDLIQPYRLELGIKFKNSKGSDLYAFWREVITSYLIQALNSDKDRTLINLASKEYYSVIDFSKLPARIITPIFKDYKNGAYRIITIYAKRSRGLMSKYIIENELEDCNRLKEFDEEGYCFEETMSTENEWVFVR